MTTQAQDTKKPPLFSLLEPDAVHLAVDESWRDRTVFEILPLFSIAISLKRIADQGEPVIEEAPGGRVGDICFHSRQMVAAR